MTEKASQETKEQLDQEIAEAEKYLAEQEKIRELNERTAKNLAAGSAITEGIPNKLLSYGGKALTTLSDITNIAGQKIADGLTGGNASKPLSEEITTEPAQRWSEYLAKRGVPGGARLSDYLTNSFEETGKGKHWYSPEKGGALDWNVRDVVGGLMDTLSPAAAATAIKRLGYDPVKKAMTKIISEANKTGSLNRTVGQKLKTQASLLPSLLIDPVRTYSDYLGRRSYMRALAPLDKHSLEYGKTLISPELFDEGVRMGPSSAKKFIDEKVETTWGRAKALANEATETNPVKQHYMQIQEAGTPEIPARPAIKKLVPDETLLGTMKEVEVRPGTPWTPAKPGPIKSMLSHETGGVDMNKAMQPARDWLKTKVVKDGKIDPALEAQHAVLSELIEKYASLGHVDVNKATDMMANIYKGMPNTAYADAIRHGFGVETSKKFAAGMKGQLPEAVDKAREEAGKWITVQDPAATWAGKQAEIPYVNPGDLKPTGPAIQKGGSYAGAVSFKAPQMALKISRMPGTRMAVGGSISDVANMGLLPRISTPKNFATKGINWLAESTSGLPANIVEQGVRQYITNQAYPELYPNQNMVFDVLQGKMVPENE